MAASSDQPVSVGNLAAALDDMGVGGETVLYSDKGNTSKSVTLSEPMEDFDVLRVTMRYVRGTSTYNATTDVFTSDINGQSSTYVLACDDDNVYRIGVIGSGTSLTVHDATNIRIARVIGIKTGGGQLLAKLLRDLCKGVA